MTPANYSFELFCLTCCTPTGVRRIPHRVQAERLRDYLATTRLREPTYPECLRLRKMLHGADMRLGFVFAHTGHECVIRKHVGTPATTTTKTLKTLDDLVDDSGEELGVDAMSTILADARSLHDDPAAPPRPCVDQTAVLDEIRRRRGAP